MPTGRKVWLALLLAGAGYELWAVLSPDHEDTLSEFVRWSFRTETKAGAVIFTVAALAFGGWFIPHILHKTKKD